MPCIAHLVHVGDKFCGQRHPSTNVEAFRRGRGLQWAPNYIFISKVDQTLTWKKDMDRNWYAFSSVIFRLLKTACYVPSCRFITIVRARLKVSVKNPPSLLLLSRGKEEERKKQQSAVFALLRKRRAGGFLAGTFICARTTVIKRQDRK